MLNKYLFFGMEKGKDKRESKWERKREREREEGVRWEKGRRYRWKEGGIVRG